MQDFWATPRSLPLTQTLWSHWGGLSRGYSGRICTLERHLRPRVDNVWQEPGLEESEAAAVTGARQEGALNSALGGKDRIRGKQGIPLRSI